MLHPSVFRNFREPFLKYKNAVFNGVQEKESIICVRMGWKNPSLTIIVCYTKDAENLLNSLRKRDKMLGKPRILYLFPNSFYKFN